MTKECKISPDYNKMFSNPNKTDIQNNNLRGNIKTVIAIKTKIDDNNKMESIPFWKSTNNLFEISSFDKNGTLINYREVYKDNILHMKMEYDFDGRNNLIEERTLNENKKIINTVNFKYNSIGQTIEEYRKETDILFTAIYNNSGILEKVINKSQLQGYGEKCYNIKRDSKNNIIEVIEIIRDKKIKTEFEYDFENKLVKLKEYNSKNEMKSFEEMEYDQYQNMTKLTYKEEAYTSVFDYKFEYDDNGNWLTSTVFIDGVLDSKTEREIEYY